MLRGSRRGLECGEASPGRTMSRSAKWELTQQSTLCSGDIVRPGAAVHLLRALARRLWLAQPAPSLFDYGGQAEAGLMSDAYCLAQPCGLKPEP